MLPTALLSRSPLARTPAAQVLLTYGIVLLAGGHGVVPAALLLVGGLERFLFAVLAGWLGVAVLAATLIPPLARVRALPWTGVGLLASSVASIVWRSEEPLISAASALPFGYAAGKLLWREARAHGLARQPS